MNHKYASFGQRLLAHLIDNLLGWPIFFYYLLILIGQTETAEILNTFLSLVLVSLWYGIILLFLQAYLTSKYGGSLGKLVTGIKVISENGSYLTFWKALFRELALKPISHSFLGLGFFWLLKDSEKQTWHDKAANTHVVSTKHTLTLLGLVLLLSIIGIAGYTVSRIYQTVENSIPVYQQFTEEVSKTIGESFEKELSPSPTPGKFKIERIEE